MAGSSSVRGSAYEYLDQRKYIRVNGTTQPALTATLPRLEVQFDPVIHMDNEQFFQFCQRNCDQRIERTATGKVIIMSPAGGETGSRNAELTFALRQWAKRNKRGVAFDLNRLYFA